MSTDDFESKARVRRDLGYRYIEGSGIEIGAAHWCLQVPPTASVKYVDVLTAQQLRESWDEIKDEHFVPETDILDDGEKLDKVADDSLDFLIANHFLEHCRDTIGTLQTHLRKVKVGGTLFYAVPNRAKTFDAQRPGTPFEHHERDWREGPESYDLAHYREWARFVENTPGDKVEQRARQLLEEGQRIHFHCWTPDEFVAFLSKTQNLLDKAFHVEEFVADNGNEFIVVLRRTGRGGPRAET